MLAVTMFALLSLCDAGESSKISATFSIGGPNCGILKEEILRIREVRKLDELCTRLIKLNRDSDADHLSRIIKTTFIDFEKFECIFIFGGKCDSRAVLYSSLTNSSIGMSLRVKHSSYQTSIESQGSTPWGLIVVPKCDAVISIDFEEPDDLITKKLRPLRNAGKLLP